MGDRFAQQGLAQCACALRRSRGDGHARWNRAIANMAPSSVFASRSTPPSPRSVGSPPTAPWS
jgi:hypothetical protein